METDPKEEEKKREIKKNRYFEPAKTDCNHLKLIFDVIHGRSSNHFESVMKILLGKHFNLAV